MPINFCANLSFMFQESSSLLERYILAKNAGFKAVECAFPYEYPLDKVLAAKKESKVQQILINAYPGDWSKGDRGLAVVRGRQAEFKESLKKSVEYANKLECKRIHIMSGVIEEETTQEHFDIFIENLEFATKILEKSDIIGVIEPINHYSLPNYYLNSYQKALSAIQTINSPFLRLQLDIFHLQQINGNLSRNIEGLLPYVGHIQIAQVPDRHEPDTPGEIDYKYVLSLLEKLGYDGWIGLEYIPQGKTTDGLKWINHLGYLL